MGTTTEKKQVIKQKHMNIYPVEKYTKVGVWFRRLFLGHYVVEGKQLKKVMPKGSVDKRYIKNKKLYGVKVTIK